MTTRLSGDSTRFLPFNRGNGDRAGNPARSRVPHRLPVGGGVVTRRLARPARPVRAHHHRRRGQEGHALPPLPPVERRAVARRRRPLAGRRAVVPRAALGGVGQVEHDRLARPPAVVAALRRRPAGVRQGRRDHRPARARPAAPGDDLPVRAHPRRRRQDRPGLQATRRGARGGAGAHRHHHHPEVPARDEARRGAGVAPLRRHHRRGPLVADRRLRQGDEEGARRRPVVVLRLRGVAARGGRSGGGVAGRRGARSGAGPPRQGGRRPRAPGEHVVLRLHRHPEGPHARAVRAAGRVGQVRAVPPVLDAPGDRGGLHPRRARQLRHLRHLLQDRQGDHRRPRARQVPRQRGDRPVRLAARAQPRPARRRDRQPLPLPRRPPGRRPGEGDGGHRLPAPRPAVQAGARQVLRRARHRRRRRAVRVLRHARRRR